ncbi:MAG TPA: hypothetical protein VF460_09010 [Burkholderiales bacterium]
MDREMRRWMAIFMAAVFCASPLWAQDQGTGTAAGQGNAVQGDNRINADSGTMQPGARADAPQPQSPADKADPRRNVWTTPLAGFAAALGITGLLSRLGLNESVAAAFGGVLLVIPLIVIAFLAWQFIRRRRVLDPSRNHLR